jgi:opacity protein-like surface antigen
MKTKQNLILALSLTAVSLIGAINTNAQKVEIGLRYMPTVSALDLQTSTGGTVKGEATLGYGVGALLGYNFTNHIGIQGEIIYSSTSQKYTEKDVVTELHLKYVNVPLLLSLNTSKLSSVNLNVVAGPQIGFNVGANVNTSGGDGIYNSQAEVSVKKSDIGLAYGAGLDFGLNETKTMRLGIGFRGVFGLIDISDNSQTQTTESYYVLDKTNLKTYSAYIGFSIII